MSVREETIAWENMYCVSEGGGTGCKMMSSVSEEGGDRVGENVLC